MLEVIFRDTYISVEVRSFTMENATHKKVADILTKANFSHEAPGLWQRTDDLAKWYEQCQKLVAKVGGDIIDKRGESKIGEFSYFQQTEKPADIPPVPSPQSPDIETRLITLETEVMRLGEMSAIASQELQQLEQQLKQLS